MWQSGCACEILRAPKAEGGDGVGDIESVLIHGSGGPGQTCTLSLVGAELIHQGHKCIRIAGRGQRDSIGFAPDGFGTMPGGRYDSLSMVEAGHETGAATGDSVRVRLNHQIASANVAR